MKNDRCNKGKPNAVKDVTEGLQRIQAFLMRGGGEMEEDLQAERDSLFNFRLGADAERPTQHGSRARQTPPLEVLSGRHQQGKVNAKKKRPNSNTERGETPLRHSIMHAMSCSKYLSRARLEVLPAGVRVESFDGDAVLRAAGGKLGAVGPVPSTGLNHDAGSVDFTSVHIYSIRDRREAFKTHAPTSLKSVVARTTVRALNLI